MNLIAALNDDDTYTNHNEADKDSLLMAPHKQ
jgi:hypothetical protein